MPNPDYPIALLSQALVALWFETLATEPSGALALLEPRIAEKGPRCATDGEILWVDAWAVQEWLREPTNKKGRNALAAAGLELLYFWRQENGPWLIPGTSSDTVMTGVELPTWGDWVLEVQQSGNAGEQGIPDSSWRAGIWWKKQSENLWTGTLPDDHLVQLPDYWQVPLAPDALNLTQAKSTWRECMRDLRRHMGPGNPQVEKQWVDECLEHHPQELDAWMELDPPVPVSKNALFNLKDPKWVKEFLRRGAQTDTTLVGRSLLHHAV